MKKQFFLLTLLVSSAQFVLAQGSFSVYQEDFSGGIPSDWQVVDNTPSHFLEGNGGSSAPSSWETITTSQNEEVVSISLYDADYDDTRPNDYLITGPIDLTQFGGNLTLLLDIGHPSYANGNYADEVLPVYAANASDTLSFLNKGVLELVAVNSNTPPYTQISIPLPASYAGQTLYLAFRYGNLSDEFAYMVADGANTTLGLEINAIEITATDVLGIEDNQKLAASFYPNPVGDRLHIQFPTAQAREAEVSLYNMLGQLVMQELYTEGGIDVNQLNAGIYLARVTAGGKTQTLKIIKK